MSYAVNLLVTLFIFFICWTKLSSGKNAVQLIAYHGYPLEIHHVTTKDGYVLELHRIPRGINEKYQSIKRSKKVVLLTQSITYSSAAFVALGPKKGLAYLLANSGYDVWMMNGRGTRYSQKHITLSPKSDEFWKFSWHEHGIYDLPASIDYILKLTGECQMDYIGYSMGATMLFVLMSEKPTYVSKIRTLIGVAPAVYLNNSPGLATLLTPFLNTFAKLFANLRRLSFPPLEFDLGSIMAFLCGPSNEWILGAFCDEILNSLSAGGNNIDRKILPSFFKDFPDTTSLRTLFHFAQLRNTAKFEKYNFGKRTNQLKYGSPSPPLYNLSVVPTQISLFWGGRDDWVSNGDVTRLISELPNVEYSKFIASYNHFDFIWGKNAPSILYKPIIERLIAARNSSCG